MASRLRATMRAMETAAAVGDLATLHRQTREQVRVLEKLKREGSWSDAQLMAFLADGVKSLHDPELEEIVGQKVAVTSGFTPEANVSQIVAVNPVVTARRGRRERHLRVYPDVTRPALRLDYLSEWDESIACIAVTD